jgi:hypothetical protein
VLFAHPAQVEGPVLLRVGAGHAITVLDAVAIVPLVASSSLFFWGIWRKRIFGALWSAAIWAARRRWHFWPVGLRSSCCVGVL